MFTPPHNNDKKLSDAIRAATDVTRTRDERERTRYALREYMEMRPYRASGAARDTASTSITTIFTYIRIPAVLGLAILFVGGGTAAAAEGALPGDILYPVKVNINEEVRSALTLSDEAQADWQISRTERRLEEAAALAARGGLTNDTRSQIEERIEGHLAAASKSASDVAVAQGAEAAVETETRLQAVLTANSDTLALLAEQLSGMESRAQLDSIVTSLRARTASILHPDTAAATLSATADNTESVAKDTAPDRDAYILAQQSASTAIRRIGAAEALFARASGRISTDLAEHITAELETAQRMYASGEESLSADNPDAARAAFTEALRTALAAHSKLTANLNVFDATGIRLDTEHATRIDSEARSDRDIENRLRDIDIDVRTEEERQRPEHDDDALPSVDIPLSR